MSNIILHGDSRELAATITEPIRCILTDPPFGMAFQSNFAVKTETIAKNRKIEGDDDPKKAIELFYSVIRPTVHLWREDFEMYVFTSWHAVDVWKRALERMCETLNATEPFKKNKIELKMMLIWWKNGGPGMGDTGSWGCGYEIIFFLQRQKAPNHPYRREGILSYDRVPPAKQVHPTEKPLDLLQTLIEMSTNPGDLVYDPFSGSGSTSAAAQRCGRSSIAFELDEGWYKESLKKLEQPGLFGGL